MWTRLHLVIAGLMFFASIQPALAHNRKHVCSKTDDLELKAIEISAKLFSPNKDGRLDETEITLLVSVEEKEARHKKFRLVGKMKVEGSGAIRTLSISVLVPPFAKRSDSTDVTISVNWDGLTDSGQLAPDGDYRLTLILDKVRIKRNKRDRDDDQEEEDDDEHERRHSCHSLISDLGLVRVDNTPPSLNIESPSAGFITKVVPFLVEGQAFDENGTTEVSVNGMLATLLGTQFSASLAPPEGRTSLVARAMDAAGNLAESAPVDVAIDFTPPSVSFLCPQNGIQTSNAAISVVGDVSDNIEVVSVTVNGIPANVIGNTFSIPSVELASGDNFLVAVALDRAGNSSTSSPLLIVRVDSQGAVIATVAGDGSTVFDGDAQLAIDASLNNPIGLGLDYAGLLYIVDNLHQRIRRVDSSGIISTFAGSGVVGFEGDGGEATAAQFRSPQDVAFGPDGSFYISDSVNRRIRKITPDGIIQTIAGNGGFGSLGDGGPALQASFSSPEGIDVDDAGNIYIADPIAQVVRKVDTNGIITRFAGGGSLNADGIPALDAQFGNPMDVSITASGAFLIPDRRANKIRMVSPNGIISTVAGNGVFGFGGDGGLATGAKFAQPIHAVMDRHGNILITDSQNHRIRRVKPDGTIETAVGTGIAGFSGDGGPPESAQMFRPLKILITGPASYLISDAGNHRVRRVEENMGDTTPDQCGFE